MSFYYAVSGFFAALRRESHLRFHVAVGNLIAVFAYFYGISAAEWAVLAMCVFSVISAELLNTAVERAVDTATEEICPTAKLAKDAAAAAVLVLAVCSVIVGICLFGDFERIRTTLIHIFSSAKILVFCLSLGTADAIFLIFGGKNDK